MVIKNKGCMTFFINMWFISIKNSFDNEIICLLCFIYDIGVGPKSICGGCIRIKDTHIDNDVTSRNKHNTIVIYIIGNI